MAQPEEAATLELLPRLFQSHHNPRISPRSGKDGESWGGGNPQTGCHFGTDFETMCQLDFLQYPTTGQTKGELVNLSIAPSALV